MLRSEDTLFYNRHAHPFWDEASGWKDWLSSQWGLFYLEVE